MTRTTFQQHARLSKKIINLDRGEGLGDVSPYLMCLWDECDRPATSLYQKRYCEHDARTPCQQADARALGAGAGRGAHYMTAFCSQRHLEYWWNATGGRALASLERSGRAYGNLPAGSRGRAG